MVSNDIPGSN